MTVHEEGEGVADGYQIAPSHHHLQLNPSPGTGHASCSLEEERTVFSCTLQRCLRPLAHNSYQDCIPPNEHAAAIAAHERCQGLEWLS